MNDQNPMPNGPFEHWEFIGHSGLGLVISATTLLSARRCSRAVVYIVDGATMIEAEEALVIRSRTGDRLAFEQLVRRSARGIYCRIYPHVPDSHRCEDLVQETYLRAWKRIGSLSDPSRFRGWLAEIARSVVLDAIKHDARRKRGKPAGSEAAMLQVADAKPDPSQSSQQREQRRRLLEVLKELPAEYRDALTLRYLAGADYDAIAKQLAISNGSLRGLLNRGMKLLRERLKDDSER